MPAPEIKSVTFDEDIWHPLDHWILDARCRSFQPTWKAARLHLNYWRDFQLPDQLAPIKRRLLCSRGFHQVQKWWRTGEPESRLRCANCSWRPEDLL